MNTKTFEHQWICEGFLEHPTFFTKRMFGGLAVYLFERQMLLLVEPTKSGRWSWHGVFVCTDYAHHASIRVEFPALTQYEILRKWLFVDSAHEAFETTMEAVARQMANNDPRFGILPGRRSSAARPDKKRPGLTTGALLFSVRHAYCAGAASVLSGRAIRSGIDKPTSLWPPNAVPVWLLATRSA